MGKEGTGARRLGENCERVAVVEEGEKMTPARSTGEQASSVHQRCDLKSIFRKQMKYKNHLPLRMSM